MISMTTCKHNPYWRTVYDNCMACRAEKAESDLAQAQARVAELVDERDTFKRLYERGRAVEKRPCMQCGYVSKIVRALQPPVPNAKGSPMNAGRELDALIAEKVMGWRKAGTLWITPTGQQLVEYHHEWMPEATPPRYSTSIGAAWQVVEKLPPHSVDINNENPGGWICSVHTQLGYWEARARTAPLAICLAALKFVGALQTDEGDVP